MGRGSRVMGKRIQIEIGIAIQIDNSWTPAYRIDFDSDFDPDETDSQQAALGNHDDFQQLDLSQTAQPSPSATRNSRGVLTSIP